LPSSGILKTTEQERAMKIHLLLGAALLTSTAFANEEGKELHDEACIACHVIEHDDAFYTRENSRLSDYAGLRRQTSMCASNFGVGWFPDEETSVVDYLNTKYYKFSK